MARTVEEIKAAAARFSTKLFKGPQQSSKRGEQTARQVQSFTYWDSVPEVRFSGIWLGRMMSKATLILGVVQEDGEIVQADDDHPGWDIVSQIAGGVTGQSQLLEQFGPQLMVPGEAWIVVKPRKTKAETPVDVAREYDWHVVPVTLVKQRGKDLTVEIEGEDVKIPAFEEGKEDPDAPVAIRVWSPHPARYDWADSPVMSAFTILDELLLLNAAVSAIAKSRLGGRGVLAIPQGASLPDGDDLMEKIMDVAEIAYKDPSSAAAVVPIVLEVPKDSEPKHIKFESDFDELAVKLREEAIRRYATGADIPAEVLLGMGDMNHWGVWASKEEAISIGVEPRLATVCDALTREYLWPLLDTPERDVVVWYDTAGLRARANKSETAMNLGRDGVISGEAVRRETGFDDDDAPPPAMERLALYLKIANVIPSDDPARMVVTKLITDLISQIAGEEVSVPEIAPPEGDVELPVDETQAPPDTMPSGSEATPPDQADADVLAAAVDQMIVRALERAGHRIMKRRGRSARKDLQGLSAALVYRSETPTRSEVEEYQLLGGAWDRVPELAQRYGVDEDCLEETLDSYTRDLLLSGRDHDFKTIPFLIREATCFGRGNGKLHLEGQHDQADHGRKGEGKDEPGEKSRELQDPRQAHQKEWKRITKEIHAQGLGNCYQASGTLMMHQKELGLRDPRIVHAEVAGQGKLEGQRFGHAWVEEGNEGFRVAYDFSSGNEVELTAEVYRVLGDATKVKEYSEDEAMKMMLKVGTYGPWE